MKTKLITGGLAVDDRGTVSFINDFSFTDIKRFYQVSNHSSGFVRAWHGHRYEEKYVYVVSGSAIVKTCQMDLDDNLLNKNNIESYTLSSKVPKILFIPAGFANGFKTLEENTILMFFSTSLLSESLNDDIRFSWDTIPGIWEDNYR